jgi:iron(III) transport system ATP-binding protein
MDAPDAPAALRVDGLRKIYPSKRDQVLAVNEVSFDIREGHFYTLLGPSGCGKTTTLRCVAGLEKPDGGTITVGGQVMSDGGSRQFTKPHRRPMGMVFQNYAVWPHLSVFDNVAFPLRVTGRRLSSAEVTRKVTEALEMVQLESYIRRPATNLSGGQQQRLSLARALVRDPKILLLDEPLSNLDAKLRNAMRAELRSLQRRVGVTTLYVTHDQAEALSLSNRIAVMENGRIVQEGTPREIYAAPQTRFVANFVGECNFVEGTVVGSGRDGRMTIRTSAGILDALCPPEVRAGDAVTIGLRPHDLTLDGPGGEGGNVLDGVISHIYYLGEYVECQVQAGTEILALRRPAGDAIRRGDSVRIYAPSSRISVFSEKHGVARVSEDHREPGGADDGREPDHLTGADPFPAAKDLV